MAKDMVKKNGEVVHHEHTGEKRTFGQKVKRSCVRFWWLFLLIFIIIALVVILPIIYVGYPHLARKTVKEGEFVVASEIITEPAPDSVQLELHSLLLTDSKYHPTLHAFNASLYLEEDGETPFAIYQIPTIKARNGTEALVKQRVQIEHMEEFTRYVALALGTEEYTVYLKGKGGLKLGGLPKTNVNYDNAVKIKGFNKLAGLEILSFDLLTESLPDGGNSVGQVMIPNPTPMTLDLGNVTLDIFVDDTNVGNATLLNTFIEPGNNTLTMHATSNQTAVANLILAKYRCGVLPIDIKAKTSTWGGKVLPYYSKALQLAPMHASLDVAPTLRKLEFGYILADNCTTA